MKFLKSNLRSLLRSYLVTVRRYRQLSGKTDAFGKISAVRADGVLLNFYRLKKSALPPSPRPGQVPYRPTGRLPVDQEASQPDWAGFGRKPGGFGEVDPIVKTNIASS
ncbi:hypothetical protein ACLG6S_06720 [Thermodesulfobacteriota bacterium B35]